MFNNGHFSKFSLYLPPPFDEAVYVVLPVEDGIPDLVERQSGVLAECLEEVNPRSEVRLRLPVGEPYLFYPCHVRRPHVSEFLNVTTFACLIAHHPLLVGVVVVSESLAYGECAHLYVLRELFYAPHP